MWRLSLAMLVGCYAPEVREGVPCGPAGACPAALTCSPATQTCERMGTPLADAPAAFDAGDDAAPDAPPCTGMATFAYTGAIVTHQLAACATSFRIEAWGAQGGGGTVATLVGGKGAHVAGTFAIPGGATLRILVGGQGIAAVRRGRWRRRGRRGLRSGQRRSRPDHGRRAGRRRRRPGRDEWRRRRDVPQRRLPCGHWRRRLLRRRAR